MTRNRSPIATAAKPKAPLVTSRRALPNLSRAATRPAPVKAAPEPKSKLVFRAAGEPSPLSALVRDVVRQTTPADAAPIRWADSRTASRAFPMTLKERRQGRFLAAREFEVRVLDHVRSVTGRLSASASQGHPLHNNAVVVDGLIWGKRSFAAAKRSVQQSGAPADLMLLRDLISEVTAAMRDVPGNPVNPADEPERPRLTVAPGAAAAVRRQVAAGRPGAAPVAPAATRGGVKPSAAVQRPSAKAAARQHNLELTMVALLRTANNAVLTQATAKGYSDARQVAAAIGTSRTPGDAVRALAASGGSAEAVAALRAMVKKQLGAVKH